MRGVTWEWFSGDYEASRLQETRMSHRPLERQIALVTGGNAGIGRACALALSRAGAAVAVNHRPNDTSA